MTRPWGWYTWSMEHINPKLVRRRIMEILYQSYQDDPLRMLSPYDIAEHGTVVLEDLTANCHYLHDRSLIELMVGYNPPMFDAARIAPEGIEIYEDMTQFDKLFPRDPTESRLRAPNIIPLMTQMAREAEDSTLDGLRREWLLRDLSHLRDELRRPEDEWRPEVILRDLQWLEGLLESEEDAQLPSLEKLKATLDAWLT